METSLDISTLSAVLMACVLAVQGLSKMRQKQVIIHCPNKIDELWEVVRRIEKSITEIERVHEEKGVDGIARVECRLTPAITQRLERIEDCVKDVRRYQKNGGGK